MSCSTCSAKFGFMKKEVGCPGCGFSSCSKCLKYEVDNKMVCKKCSEQQKKPIARPPPDIFLKRIETLEDPTKPPVTVYAHQLPPSLQNLQQDKAKDSEPPSDTELRGRLQKLRQRLTAAPSVEEIEERLAKLQGVPQSQPKHNVLVETKKTGEEQTRDLVEQMQEEAALRKKFETSWQADVEARLAKLKGQTLQEGEKSETAVHQPDTAEDLLRKFQTERTEASMEPVDEETELDVVNKIIAKIALKEKLKVDDSEASDEESISEAVTEELPWCCICNEDASLRCPGCAGDLFCSRCFKEGHDVCDMSQHKPIKYQPPKEEDL